MPEVNIIWRIFLYCKYVIVGVGLRHMMVNFILFNLVSYDPSLLNN